MRVWLHSRTTPIMSNTSFILSQEQLLEIARTLQQRIEEGLKTPGQEIQAIPTYIPVETIPHTGRALVVDFGGTNLRAAVVSLHEGKLTMEKGPATSAIPLQRNVAMDRDLFLDYVTELIASIDPPQDLPFGYCFSYPTLSTPDGDAKLIKWTKEVFVNDTVNEKVGEMLLKHLAAFRAPVKCSNVAVVNDTVAAMLGGLTAEDADGYIGLIVGTGTNMALVLDAKAVPKLPKELNWHWPLPINLESGNFRPPHLTTHDDQLDAQSENPGQQRFEKSVSGVYLAKLLKLACPESEIDVAIGAKAVVELAYHTPDVDLHEKEIAMKILQRSAHLVAASLAGSISIIAAAHPCKKICIVAEGGLFWGCPDYKGWTSSMLNTLLTALGHDHVQVDIVSVSSANLLGSAVAALSEFQSK